MNVCLLVLRSDSLTFTVARALAYAGHRVLVWVADVERDQGSHWSQSPRLKAIPGVIVVANRSANPPERIDHLIVQGHPQLLNHRDVLELLAARATGITAITAGDRNRPYRQALKLQWQERRWYGAWFSKIRRIAYKDGHYPVDWLGLLRPRRVVGFDPHSKFLHEEAMFQAIHARDWDKGVTRPIRVNFLGSRDPERRSRILDSIEPFFVSATRTETGQRLYWHVYSDVQPAALSGEEFLQVLTDSDFTLAPPGYSLVTHRPIEALLRGSIPVLNANELDLYDLGLVDGVNCIAVPPGGWPAALQRIIRMHQAEVVAMRRNIEGMLDEKVVYPALARDICRRLAVEDQAAT